MGRIDRTRIMACKTSSIPGEEKSSANVLDRCQFNIMGNLVR